MALGAIADVIRDTVDTIASCHFGLEKTNFVSVVPKYVEPPK